MNYYDQHVGEFEKPDAWRYTQANFVVLIPLTYLIIFGFLMVKYKEYKNYYNRYQKFEDYPPSKQEKILNSQYCISCKQYAASQINREEWIDGMHWIYTNCLTCKKENKQRLQ